MKNLKKLFSLAMAMVMALSLMTAAASAVVVEGDSSTTTCLTISGAVTDETYDLYRMLELSYQASTEDDVTTITAISYSIDETWLPFFQGEGAEYLIAENTGGLNTVIVDDTKMYLNITEVLRFVQLRAFQNHRVQHGHIAALIVKHNDPFGHTDHIGRHTHAALFMKRQRIQKILGNRQILRRCGC